MLAPLAVLAAILTSVMLTDPGRADEGPPVVAEPAATGPISVQASPVVGLTDGEEIPVVVTARPGVVILSSGPARVCRTGVAYAEPLDFNPQGGNCPEVRFAPSTVSPQATLKLRNNALTGTAKAPVGTAEWGDASLTCGPGAPCALVVRASVSVDGGPAETVFHSSTILTYQSDPSDSPITVETGPTTDLVDGSEIPVTVTAKPGTVILSSGPARVCRTGVAYAEPLDFNPQGGNCPEVRFAPSTVSPQATLKLRDNELAGTAKAPVGTAEWGDASLTCGPGAPCALVVRASVSVDGGPAETIFDASTTLVYEGDDPLPSFSDVPPGHQFYDDIMWLAESEITTGFPDGTFRPTLPVSRQSMAAFLYRYAGFPEGPDPMCETAPFSDVPASDQFCGEIEWLVDEGITTGFPDGTFRPTVAVSRQSMAAFLYRFSGSPDGPDPVCETAPFTDVPADHLFCGDIQWLVETGVTTGFDDDTYRPTLAVSRQAMAAFLHRLSELP